MKAVVSAVGPSEQLASEDIMSQRKFSRPVRAIIGMFVFALGGAGAASWFMP
jgi:hypothetical protein